MIFVHKIFVNDISASEQLVRNGSSDMQSNLDCITSCSSQNFMKINGMKCKEMQVCFLWETPELSPRVINGQILGNSTLSQSSGSHNTKQHKMERSYKLGGF